MSAMSRWVLAPLFVLAAAGCCHTSEERAAFELLPGDLRLSCEVICESEIDEELVECSFGQTEDGEQAVICAWEETHCPSHM